MTAGPPAPAGPPPAAGDQGPRPPAAPRTPPGPSATAATPRTPPGPSATAATPRTPGGAPSRGGLRIAVVGPIGSGKTVLAGRLSRHLAVPHLCLDDLYWGWNWQPVAEGVFHDGVRHALTATDWVAEGVHGGVAADLLFSRAQLVVWLDLPRWLCVSRALRRAVGNIHHRRLLWGKNVDSWRRFLSRDSIGLAALRHHGIGQAELRDRLAGDAPVPVTRLRTRGEIATWLAQVDTAAIAARATVREVRRAGSERRG